jgi:hypothetical protein
VHQNNDNYVSRSVQTIHDAQKSKEIQATAQTFEDAEVNATQWGIYDAYHEVTKQSAAGEIELSIKVADLENISVSAALHAGSEKLRHTNSNLGSRSIDRSASIFTTSEDEATSVLASAANLGTLGRSAGGQNASSIVKGEETVNGGIYTVFLM